MKDQIGLILAKKVNNKKLKFFKKSYKNKRPNQQIPIIKLSHHQAQQSLHSISSIFHHMKRNKIDSHLQSFHGQPSSTKLEQILQDRYSSYHAHPVQLDIFSHLKIEFKINQIFINVQQHLHTIFIPTSQKQHKDKIIFMTHGFGGSSLMYFPIVKSLLQYGNVVLWQLRGMGLSRKLKKYHVPVQQTQQFFVHPIELMLKFYINYKEIIFISHSLGAYLILIYLIKYKTFTSKINDVILFSPVGITPKEQDYKSKVKSFSDCLHFIGNKISWIFGLTYKSPFRCFCACMKQRVFTNAVKGCGFTEKEERLMKDLLIAMVELKDGSENIFFKYFEPRVIPKIPIEPIFNDSFPVKVKIFYGNEQDWVDKTGAERLLANYPQKIELKIVKQCGHNFPFSPQVMRRILQKIFSQHQHGKFHQSKNEQKQKIQDLMNHLGHQNQNQSDKNEKVILVLHDGQKRDSFERHLEEIPLSS